MSRQDQLNDLSKKTNYEEIKKTSLSAISLGHDNIENIDLSSETILNKETENFSIEKLQKIIDYANINNYQSSYGPLADDIDVSVDYGMNLLDNEVLVDSEKFDVTKVLVDDMLEDSNESNFTDDVLEDMTTEFEGLSIIQGTRNKKWRSIHSTDNHYIHENGKELWLNKEEPNLVNPTNVKRCIIVWLCNIPEPSEYEFYIKEIVYCFNGKWKYCEIKMQYRLPCKNIALMPSLPRLPTLKVFLDIYVDDFSTYRNIYHLLDGIYFQFGNMLLDLWKQLKNYFLIGFVLFEANFNDFIELILQEIK
ncbi:45454_t:CDS:2 [Gigaspora margarita]|uniref:45454_t:CDS:1 n=1 Tax=Gigaspora margarita TaxID=4874 RepID=A0ABN7VXN2_GIGMA|nr:45454_t:CDS:2 [Gigaspora margarita]